VEISAGRKLMKLRKKGKNYIKKRNIKKGIVGKE
jgi:hypothetical protein